ncbi:hypothetical protein [Kordia sp.]|uniref:hypothetical protein n=1 Tax=Kordia sp. TaxID=1965332 RepID=UPI003D2C4B7B
MIIQAPTVTATIPAGQTTVNVSIPITDDTVGEPTEDFTVNGSVTSGNTSNTTDSGIVTITDNDTPAFTVGDVTVAEDGGSAHQCTSKQSTIQAVSRHRSSNHYSR